MLITRCRLRIKICLLSFLWVAVGALPVQGQSDTLRVDFKPSFIESSRLTIVFGRVRSHVNLSMDANRFSHQPARQVSVSVTRKQTKALRIFLQTYPVPIIQELYSESKEGMSIGTDGITVALHYLKASGPMKEHSFWSPRRNSVNHQFVTHLFDVMEHAFQDTTAIKYMDHLRIYFDFGLGLKHISQKPSTYKLFGAITSNETNALRSFLSQVRLTKSPVYIDMSGFFGMGTMFYPDFQQLIQSKQDVYWVNCTQQAVRQLTEIGVNPAQMITRGAK